MTEPESSISDVAAADGHAAAGANGRNGALARPPIAPRQAPQPVGSPVATDDASWGRYPRIHHETRSPIDWRGTDVDFAALGPSVLPHGLGRSYGDSCLNEGGALIETERMNRLIAFDAETGLLTCEAGTTFEQVLQFGVPRGWFLPTTPGTRYVTVGGAIANDVHGKNHHVAGAFGRHVAQFELLRSDGSRYLCSPTENVELYKATIGGLGLTGLILWAQFKLRRVAGPYIDMESVRFSSLDGFFEITAGSDRDFEFTMSWIDCLATGPHAGRGHLMRGNHAWQPRLPGKDATPKQRLGLPFDVPSWLMTGLTMRAFNELLYRRQIPQRIRRVVPYTPFFYPLDSFNNWNRLYGKRGFLQHQCVVPHAAAREAVASILRETGRHSEGSFLAVLKTFGDLPSPGMLSFPRPGVTLALDFALKGESTFKLLDSLDDIVMAHGGAVYPAKDARMSPACFEAGFPNWRDFAKYVDERFSSSFWRRVTGQVREAPTI